MKILSVALVFCVVACSDPPTGEVATPPATACGDSTTTPTADTMIAAEVDGQSFLVAAGSPGAFLRLRKAGQQVALYGRDSRGGQMRAVRLWFAGFHGVGGYSVSASDSAGAFYQCGGATHWAGASGADSAWVTAFDTATGHLEGSFAFGSPDWAGGMVTVTGGRFSGSIAIDSLPDAVPYDHCDVSQASDSATASVTAQVDGRLFAGHEHIYSDFYAPADGRLFFSATTYHDWWQETIKISLKGVFGPGAYPIQAIDPDAAGQAAYYCEDSPDGYVWSTGAAGDSVWVTALDTVTGAATGSFIFHGTGELSGRSRAITSGAFHIQAEIDHAPISADSVSAHVAGRVFLASEGDTLGLLPGDAPVRIEIADSMVNVVAIHPRAGCEEVVQVWLFPFAGVGTYPLYPDTALARSARGGAVVGCLDSHLSYWAFEYPSAHDTAFVTAYDSVTGRIEGSFHFVGVREGTADSVAVTDGVFRGTLRPYLPGH